MLTLERKTIGLARNIYIQCICGIFAVFLAGKSPYIPSYTVNVHIYTVLANPKRMCK